MTPHRRQTDHNVVVRSWLWCTAPFVDGQHGLSLTRGLSIYFALLIGHLVEHTHSLPGNVLMLALATIATAFGKSTFQFLLDRRALKAEVAAIAPTNEPTPEATP